MKKLTTVLLALVVILLNSCVKTVAEENELTTQWINKATKPVICKPSTKAYSDGAMIYFITDAKGNTFIANGISASLPDTIK